jgi:hypothetical protein
MELGQPPPFCRCAVGVTLKILATSETLRASFRFSNISMSFMVAQLLKSPYAHCKSTSIARILF